MDDVHHRLSGMLKKEGPDIVSMAGMCEIALRRALPEHPEVVRALTTGVEKGVAQQIRKTPNAMAREMLIPQWQQQLMNGTGFSAEQARWVIDVWGDAFDTLPQEDHSHGDHEPRRKAAGPDTDAALYLLLGLGALMHLLVFVGINGYYQLFVEGQKEIKYIPLEETIKSVYLIFLPISGAVTLIVFCVLSAMYGHDVPLDRTLRNFLCVFAYVSGMFVLFILLGGFTGWIISIFLVQTLLPWILQFFGFRVFIIASILSITQYILWFILVLLHIVLPVHMTFGAEINWEGIEGGARLPEQRIPSAEPPALASYLPARQPGSATQVAGRRSFQYSSRIRSRKASTWGWAQSG